jgi:DNA-binding transcriptional ArsR family regulator
MEHTITPTREELSSLVKSLSDELAQTRLFVLRLLDLTPRDKYDKKGHCLYCRGLGTPTERKLSRCPNCASMRRAMKEMALGASK